MASGSEYAGSLKYDTEIDEKGFNSGISKLGSLAKGGLSIAAKSIGGVVTALGAGAVAGLKYNATVEQLTTSFEVMTGSADEAASIVQRLQEIGAATPFEFTDLANTTNMLMQFGFTADDAISSMQMLGDISQGSAEKMDSIARAYGKMSSAGKVSLEDINMMIDAGFNPLQEISETTGESMASLYERISDGAVSVDEITASMQRSTAEGGKYFKSMEKQSQTFSGLISTLQDNAMSLLGEVVQPISESMVSTLLPAAIDAIGQMTEAFQSEGVDGLIKAGTQILSNLLLGITKGLPDVLDTAIQIIDSIIQNLTDSIPQFLSAGVSIVESIVSGMFQLLPSVGNFVIQLITQIYTLITAQAPGLLQKGYELLNNIVSGFVSGIPIVLPQILSFVQSIGTKIAEFAPTLIDKGFELLSKLVEGITSAFPILIQKVPEIISTFANIINDNFPTIIKKGFELIVQFVSGIISAIPEIISNMPKIVSAVVDVIKAFNWLSLGKNIITLFKNGITNMVGAVKNAGKSVYDAVHNAIKNLPQTLQNIGKTAMSGLGSAIRGLVSTVGAAASSVGYAILDALTSIPGKVISIGKDIVTGLWNGISGMVGWITDKVMGFANSILGGIKKALGIHSPSAVMRDEVGKMMALGMGIGFEDNIPEKDMEKSLNKAFIGLQGAADSVMTKTPSTAAETVKHVTNNYTGGNINYRKLKRAQLEAMNEANERPIILNGRNLRRATDKGGPVTV